ncbi:MAG: phosphoglycerate kinase, partial [Hyphomonas sp.]
MASFKRITDAGNLTGKVALVRVDFNVPMENGLVTDDTRLRAAVDTVQTLRTQGAKVALLAHFGRPKGERVAEMSLAPVAGAFGRVLGANVSFVADCKGEHVKKAIAELQPAGVILLENTRFYKGEEKGDMALAKDIAALGDIFVNDAFSAAHRRHVTTAVLAEIMPAYAGINMEAELVALDKALG